MHAIHQLFPNFGSWTLKSWHPIPSHHSRSSAGYVCLLRRPPANFVWMEWAWCSHEGL